MKTSNKLLTGLCLLMALCMLVGMVVAKSNMTIYPEEQGREGYTESKVIVAAYDSHILNLDGGEYRKYTLDPTTAAISATADKRNINEIRVSDGQQGVYFYREGGERVFRQMSLTIGTKGKENLIVNLKGHSKMYSAAAIDNKMHLNVLDGSEVEMHYEGPELTINAERNSIVSLRGRATKASIINEDNAVVYGQEFYTDSLVVNLIDDASVKLQGANEVSGKVKDDTALIFEEATHTHKVILQDHAHIDSGGR